MRTFATLYDSNRGRSATFATENKEESMTQQSDANESDINVIVSRYGITGQLPQVISPAQYGDFTEVTDYRTALDMVRAAQETFLEVPAKIRERFHNDPGEFHDFVTNPENLEELRKLGLAEKLPEEHPSPAPPPRTAYSDDGEVTIPEPSSPPPRNQNGNTSNANFRPSANPSAPGASGQPRGR